MTARQSVIFLCGDVMTGRGIDQIQKVPSEPTLFEGWVADARTYVALAEEKNGAVPRGVEPSYIWGDALAELDRHAPAARVVNLETAITTCDAAWPGKGINYRMHPANVGCLTAARIDVCALANNHVIDWGRRGLIDTLEALAGARISTAGAGRDLVEAQAPAVVELDGGRLLVLSLGAESSGVPEEWAADVDRPGVDLVSIDDASAAALGDRVRSLKRPGDLVVASIHWGSNWGFAVPEEHIRFAHRIIDDGVDVVHGHSSHHPRGVEVYKNKLILYGCGDLINDYEGIEGHERYRGDLALLYFATLSNEDGSLGALTMTPMQLRRLRLQRASAPDSAWLAATLEHASRSFGPGVELDAGGELVLR